MGEPVVRSIRVRAAADRAFAAFVEVGQVLSWLADGAVIGARPGGGWGLGWYADDESDAGYVLRGVFDVYEPGRRLVVADISLATPEGEELGPMRLSIDFEEVEPGETLVVVRQEWHDAVAAGPYRAGAGPGWEKSLGDLKGWLEEGRKLPGR